MSLFDIFKKKENVEKAEEIQRSDPSGYYFQNTAEFLVYSHLFAKGREILWLSGDNYAKEYAKGYDLFEQRKYKQAIEVYKNALVLNPIGISARFEICEAYMKLSNWDAARKTLLEMKDYLVENQSIAKFYRRLGFIATEQRDYRYLTAHINLDQIESFTHKLLGIKNDENQQNKIWDLIYSYVSYCNEVFTNISPESDAEAAVLDASESAYVIGMLYAMRHQKNKENKSEPAPVATNNKIIRESYLETAEKENKSKPAPVATKNEIKRDSYLETVEKWKETLSNNNPDRMLPGGKEQAKEVVLGLKDICKISDNNITQKMLSELFYIYIDVVTRIMIIQNDTEQRAVSNIRRKHPLLTDDEMAKTAWFFCRNNYSENALKKY